MPDNFTVTTPFVRRLVTTGVYVFAFVLVMQMMLLASSATTLTPAELFVQQGVDRGFKILNDKSLNEVDRRAQFRDFLLTLMDLRRVALFTLGRARATASEVDVNAFVEAFRQFAIANYETRLNEYDGQSLKVLNSIERTKDDYVVRTILIDPADPSSSSDPLEVDLRVLSNSGKFVIVDASVAGVWLGLAQRDDVAGFLSQHKGNIPDLIAHFKTITEALYKHGASSKN